MRRLVLLLSLGLLICAGRAVGETLIQLRNLQINDSDLPSAIIREVTGEMTGRTYRGREQVAEILRDALQRRGYFKANLLEAKFTVVRQDEKGEVVEVAAVVEGGRQYRLQRIAFHNATVFPEADLRRQFPIADGDVFDVGKISSGLHGLRDLYCGKGYADFTPVPDTTTNDAAGTVLLTIEVVEGSVYHFGTLSVEGESSEPGAPERLLSAWKSTEGKVFDCTLRVLRELLQDLHARPGVKPEDVFTTSTDAEAHVVNVRLRLTHSPQP